MPKTKIDLFEPLLGVCSVESDGGGVGIGGGDSSGSPPSGSPASPAPAASPGDAPAAPSESQNAFADMVDWKRNTRSDIAPPVASPQPVVPSPAPVAATPAPVAPVAPVAATAPQQPIQPVQPQYAPQPVAAAPQAPNLAAQEAAYREMRGSVRQQIASSYSLTPDRALQMATEPERVLPEMAADITVNTYEAVMQTMQQQLPDLVANNPRIQEVVGNIISGRIQQMFAAHQAEQDFFQVNQDLRSAPKSEVDRISALYIQANRNNPALTRETANREIGILVRNMLGMSPPTNTTAPPVQSFAPPAVQPQPTQGYPGNIVARTPLGAGSVAPSVQQPDSVYADMVRFARH